MDTEKRLRGVRFFVVVCLFIFFALGQTVRSAGDYAFYLLFLLALLLLIRRIKAPISFSEIWHRHWPLHFAMAGLMIALIISQIGIWDFSVKEYDKLLRLMMFPFVLWLVVMMPVRYLQYVQWAMLVGILLSVVQGYAVTDGGRLPNSGSVGFLAGVVFANMVLLLGVWSLMSVQWQTHPLSWATVLKILAFAGALYVSYLLKTRGTWLAIPVVLILLLCVFRKVKWHVKIAGFLCLAMAILMAYQSSPMMRERTKMIFADIQKYQQGEVKTSGGERIDLWRAAIIVAGDHPFFGIGRQNKDRELKHLAESGTIPAHVIDHAHMHNEFLGFLMLWGIFGLVADILLYLVPLMYFWRYRRNENSVISSSSYMGIALCTSFIIFNMTDTMMHWRAMYGFYVVSVALFYGMIIRSEYESGKG